MSAGAARATNAPAPIIRYGEIALDNPILGAVRSHSLICRFGVVVSGGRKVPESYMDAQTQGIGELIEHRRLFRVPDHQRDFAWAADDEVEQYLDDIIRAFAEGDTDYFLGLIVLIKPLEGGVWEILDGQQRLATTTMTYAAIREWLYAAGFEKDAGKIQSEFIGVSELGQSQDRARLTLNINNRDGFEKLVVNRCNDDTLEAKRDNAGKFSSERRMIDAAIACRKRVRKLAADVGGTPDEQAGKLFRLAEYARDNVKVVVMNVASTVNAYVIFESLNDRGLDLSVLDLVKNHLFGLANARLAEVQSSWSQMAANLGDRPADDFLKVYWTSRFGRIQRGRLFDEWRRKFDSLSNGKVVGFARELATAADRFAALDIPDHDVWDGYSNECRRLLGNLGILGNRQVRPIILAAIDRFTPQRMERLLRHLVTLTVRYQTVGKRRTGLLEIAAARAALGISTGQLNTPKKVWSSLAHLVPGDDDFQRDMMEYSEAKPARARYMLSELENVAYRLEHDGANPEFVPSEDLTLEHVFPRNPSDAWQDQIRATPQLRDQVHRLGNLCLLAERPNREVGSSGFDRKSRAVYGNSNLLLTSRIATDFDAWTPASINHRQDQLSDLAIGTWPLP